MDWDFDQIYIGVWDRGRTPRVPGNRNRGCSGECSSRLLSNGSVADISTREFPYPNAFSCFIDHFIENCMDIMGDRNCVFRVISYFIHGNEKQWPDVYKQMWHEL